MTPQEIRDIRVALGRSQNEFAKIIGATELSVHRWEAGKTSPLPAFAEKLTKLQEWVTRQREGKE